MSKLPPAILIILAFYACRPLGTEAASPHGVHHAAVVELDLKSDYSHIRLKRQGNVRTLVFVRDNGEEVIESMINLRRPHELLLAYGRFMFASYLLRPAQQRVMIAGMGGGGMVHFYQHYDPEVDIYAVEIDPAVVEIAEKYFHTKPSKHTHIITEDAFRYFERTRLRYDVIYMDVFLKPSRQTDGVGVPRRLKTVQFYKGLGEKLTPGGVVAINLNVNQSLGDDLDTIRAAFPQCYVFRALNTNVVVLATTEKLRQPPAVLRDRARELDTRFHATFSFQELLNDFEARR
jgi:spermidine synthase